MSLASGTPDNAESRTDPNAELDLGRAPQWMQEYAVWHRQHRNDPEARFLMYSCHDQMNGQRAGVCGGHGNRIKHICWTLRAAAASRRVLLVDWLSPEHLEEYLGPVAVDWRPNAAERAILADTDGFVPVHHLGWPDVGTAPPPVDVKYVRVTGGPPGKNADSKCYNCSGFHVGHLHSATPRPIILAYPWPTHPNLNPYSKPQPPPQPQPQPNPTQASSNTLYSFLFRPTAAFREHVRAATTTQPHHIASPHSLTQSR